MLRAILLAKDSLKLLKNETQIDSIKKSVYVSFDFLNGFYRLEKFIEKMCVRWWRREPRASIHIQRRQMYETKLLTMNNGFLKYINGCNKAQFIYFSIRIMVIFASFNRIQLIILFGCCFHSFFISSFLISIFRVVFVRFSFVCVSVCCCLDLSFIYFVQFCGFFVLFFLLCLCKIQSLFELCRFRLRIWSRYNFICRFQQQYK